MTFLFDSDNFVIEYLGEIETEFENIIISGPDGFES